MVRAWYGDVIRCPHCGATLVASRRQLFLCQMYHNALPWGFDWYDPKAPSALPPKSLFLSLLIVVACCALPFALLGYSFEFSTATVLNVGGMVLAAVLLCLLADLFVTHRQYRRWASRWICGQCQSDFMPTSKILSPN